MATLEKNKARIEALLRYREALVNTSASISNKDNSIDFDDKKSEQELLSSKMALEFRLAYFEKYIKTLKLIQWASEYKTSKVFLNSFFDDLDSKGTENNHELMQGVKAVIDSQKFREKFVELSDYLRKEALIAKICIYSILFCMIAATIVAIPLLILTYPILIVPAVILLMFVAFSKSESKPWAAEPKLWRVDKKDLCAETIYEHQKELNTPAADLDKKLKKVSYYATKNTDNQSAESIKPKIVTQNIEFQSEYNKYYFFNGKIPKSNSLVSEQVDDELIRISASVVA